MTSAMDLYLFVFFYQFERSDEIERFNSESITLTLPECRRKPPCSEFQLEGSNVEYSIDVTI